MGLKMNRKVHERGDWHDDKRGQLEADLRFIQGFKLKTTGRPKRPDEDHCEGRSRGFSESCSCLRRGDDFHGEARRPEEEF